MTFKDIIEFTESKIIPSLLRIGRKEFKIKDFVVYYCTDYEIINSDSEDQNDESAITLGLYHSGMLVINIQLLSIYKIAKERKKLEKIPKFIRKKSVKEIVIMMIIESLIHEIFHLNQRLYLPYIIKDNHKRIEDEVDTETVRFLINHRKELITELNFFSVDYHFVLEIYYKIAEVDKYDYSKVKSEILQRCCKDYYVMQYRRLHYIGTKSLLCQFIMFYVIHSNNINEKDKENFKINCDFCKELNEKLDSATNIVIAPSEELFNSALMSAKSFIHIKENGKWKPIHNLCVFILYELNSLINDENDNNHNHNHYTKDNIKYFLSMMKSSEISITQTEDDKNIDIIIYVS